MGEAEDMLVGGVGGGRDVLAHWQNTFIVATSTSLVETSLLIFLSMLPTSEKCTGVGSKFFHE